jgi:nicotinamide-nucleotide amidase
VTTAAYILTVAPVPIDDDPAGRLVAHALLGEGMPVAARSIVQEDEATLQTTLRGATGAGGFVVILAGQGSGGEIIARALARITGTRLVHNEQLSAVLEEDRSRRGEAHQLDRFALLPQGAVLWPAPSAQPCWTLEIRQAVAIVLPLDSAHLPKLIEDQLKPLARQRLDGEVRVLRTLLTVGLSAADVEDRLGAWLRKAGAVSVSCVVLQCEVGVRLMARGVSGEAALRELLPVESAARSALGDDCYGSDDDTLEGAVAGLLVERALTVSVAESCTGGLLGHRLTSIPGSSRYFERGVIVYSNRAKEELLDVPEALLRAHGAVSAPVAEAMATGICRLSGAVCGLAVTGIAGPDGGTPAKPVGTVFIAAATPAGVDVRHFRFAGDRDAVKWQSAQAALDMLRRALLRSAR